MTIVIALCGFALGNLFGITAALASMSRFRLVALLVAGYTTLVRGVPELLIIYLLFFSGGEAFLQIGRMLGVSADANPDAFIAGALSIGIIAGSYTTEVMRGALLSIPKGQHEAAAAFGMSRATKLRLITLPQLLRFALPGLGNVWQLVLKDTALISVISLAELMRASQVAAGSTHRPFFFYAVALGIYLALTGLSSGVFDRAERHTRRGLRASSA